MIRNGIEGDRCYVLKPDIVISEDPSGEVTVLDTRKGRYWRGNAGARDVLELLRTPITVTCIIAEFERQFEVERTRLHHDIGCVLKELCAAGLAHEVHR